MSHNRTTTRLRYYMFENIYQFRDIGGYQTVDNRTIAYNYLFRASALYGLRRDDQRQIYDLGVRTVIDMRTVQEIREQGATTFDADFDINVVHLPMVADHELLSTLGTMERSMSIMASVEYIYPFLQQFFATLSAVDHAVVFHCSLGIDRTGLLTAILLDVAGVAHEEIVSDFSRTNIYLAPRLPILRQRRPNYLSAQQFEQLIMAHPQAMRDLLQYLYQTHGSAREFLLHAGVPQSQIDVVVQRLVIP